MKARRATWPSAPPWWRKSIGRCSATASACWLRWCPTKAASPATICVASNAAPPCKGGWLRGLLCYRAVACRCSASMPCWRRCKPVAKRRSFAPIPTGRRTVRSMRRRRWRGRHKRPVGARSPCRNMTPCVRRQPCGLATWCGSPESRACPHAGNQLPRPRAVRASHPAAQPKKMTCSATPNSRAQC